MEEVHTNASKANKIIGNAMSVLKYQDELFISKFSQCIFYFYFKLKVIASNKFPFRDETKSYDYKKCQWFAKLNEWHEIHNYSPPQLQYTYKTSQG